MKSRSVLLATCALALAMSSCRGNASKGAEQQSTDTIVVKTVEPDSIASADSMPKAAAGKEVGKQERPMVEGVVAWRGKGVHSDYYVIEVPSEEEKAGDEIFHGPIVRLKNGSWSVGDKLRGEFTLADGTKAEKDGHSYTFEMKVVNTIGDTGLDWLISRGIYNQEEEERYQNATAN